MHVYDDRGSNKITDKLSQLPSRSSFVSIITCRNLGRNQNFWCGRLIFLFCWGGEFIQIKKHIIKAYESYI